MGFIAIDHFLWAFAFFVFLLASGALLESRFTRKGTILIMGGLLLFIASLQAGMILGGLDQMLILTMLPLTAYLPTVIGVHILSKSGFFQTVAVWTLGLLISYILTFLQDLLMRFLPLQGIDRIFVVTACLLFAACLFLLIVFRLIRQPFRTYVLHNDTNWLPLCFPVIMVFLLFSYFENSTSNLMIWILIFLTAVSIFLVIAKVLVSAASAVRIQKAEAAVSAQLNIQQREYEDICKKMELGRTYRHDMRHHLTVLNCLAREKNNEEMVQYINSLDLQMGEIEQETYCENATVNAVLSSYIGQAKEAGCAVALNIQMPPLLPFDALDICAVLANAIENAIHACRNNASAEERCISLTAVFEDERRLVVFVSNYCETNLLFDKEGLPIVPKRAGHGIGLKNVKAITEKYNGLFRCECSENTFLLRAVLFAPPQAKERKKSKIAVTTTLMSILIFCFAVNCVPGVEALTGIPVLGSLIRVVNLRAYDFWWGDTGLHLDLPKVERVEAPAGHSPEAPLSTPKPADEASLPESEPQPAAALERIPEKIQTPSSPTGTISRGNNVQPGMPPAVPMPPVTPPGPSPSAPPDLSEGIEEINRQMEAYIKLLREKFLWYVARKYNGYVALDSTYATLRNDDRLLLIRFDTTLNAGGSGTYSRHFMLDKQNGNVVELWDLFKENSDYVGVVSKEILHQMTEQVNSGLADYFIPGGIWSDDECFKKIAPDQNFYINDKNQLVIVFDEYEVAPGKDGRPEFIIPTETLRGILRQPS